MSKFGSDIMQGLLEACHMENKNKPIPELEYKGYTGSIEFSEEDNLFFGSIIGIKSSILYDGKDIDELTERFKNAVNNYLSLCKKIGLEPEKASK